MFQPVSNQASFPALEEEILAFWRERRIYELSLERRRGCEPFVFYEGPPTANGLPHPGHCLTRAIKDLFPRYRTMRGYYCERKGGWDTHGLPVEVEVCKELGIHSKEEIEGFGIEPFIHRCQESVWRYMKEWERLTERLGFWIHLDEAYVTYHQSYVESVWWSLKNLFDRGLLYQGYKIVWWWAQGGTALSSGEVGQGYREVADPSVFVRFQLLDDAGQPTETSLLVWTTTPWTLPSNQFAAVHPELEYATVRDSVTGQRLVLAAALVETIAGKVKRELVVESRCRGSELVGRRYVPPFDYYYQSLGHKTGRLKQGGQQHVAWRITAADFVTIDSGSGAVHEAPAFGEVDFDLLLQEQARFVEGEGPQLICAVAPNGTFTADAPDFQGRWVKDCDKDITRDMKARGLLYHQEQYLHDYPFCWRAEDDPLIQYPRKSWFIRTTKFKERMLENNRRINWLPEHIREGRFGNFLESNVDWALSRERYWGTPLPIWVCEKTGGAEAVDSYAKLLAKPGVTGAEIWEAAKKKKPSLPDDLRVHKPYIDAITYNSPFAPGARMRRVTEVIDCWYDSGAMPFAQWGYPHQGQQLFHRAFPADFISEAIDQTRGWFYSQLAISTMLFGETDEQDESDKKYSKNQLGAKTANPGSVPSTPYPVPSTQYSVPSTQYSVPSTQYSVPSTQYSVPSTPDPVPFPHPFRNCVVLGLMLAEWWECGDCKSRVLEETAKCGKCGGKLNHRVGKMSKQLRNYREPREIFDRFGADALRWYFFANQAPWNSIVYAERAIKESIPEFLLRLWNVFSFFVIYGNIDGFVPAAALAGQAEQLRPADLAGATGYRPVRERSELDRWVLSELNRTTASVIQNMDAYDNYGACQRLHAFVDGLSNWYVRRSRERFWSGDKFSPEKLDAYWTLYECLLTTSKLIAPFVPFLAETLWRNLAGVFGQRTLQSVHLCDYPVPESAAVDDRLSQQMELLREIASLGRSARMDAKLKVRQPLQKVEVILADTTHQAWLEAHHSLLCEELNVKEVEFTKDATRYITYLVQPNFKRLGPRVGKLMPAVKQALQTADGSSLLAQLNAEGKVRLNLADSVVELDGEDIQVRLQAKEGWAAAQGKNCVVVLATDLTPALILEGIANDVVRAVQERRKDLSCQYTDRIEIGVVTDSSQLRQALAEYKEYIAGETLAVRIVLEPLSGVEGLSLEIGDEQVTLYVRVARDIQ